LRLAFLAHDGSKIDAVHFTERDIIGIFAGLGDNYYRSGRL
jgi:hypothetical protein